MFLVVLKDQTMGYGEYVHLVGIFSTKEKALEASKDVLKKCFDSIEKVKEATKSNPVYGDLETYICEANLDEPLNDFRFDGWDIVSNEKLGGYAE